jgi:hypothetical protein
MIPSTGTTAVCSTATVSTTTLKPATNSLDRVLLSPDVVDRFASASTTWRSDR